MTWFLEAARMLRLVESVGFYEIKNKSIGRGARERGYDSTEGEVMVYDDFSHFAISFSRSNLGSSGSVTTV